VTAEALRAVPLGLEEGATVLRPIAKGEMLTADNCAPDETLTVTRLRHAQDAADAAAMAAA